MKHSRMTSLTLFLTGCYLLIVGKNPSKTDSIKSKISPKTSGGKKDSTKRRHQVDSGPCCLRSGDLPSVGGFAISSDGYLY